MPIARMEKRGIQRTTTCYSPKEVPTHIQTCLMDIEKGRLRRTTEVKKKVREKGTSVI